MARSNSKKQRLGSLQATRTEVLEVEDSRTVTLSTGFLSRHAKGRDTDAVTAKLIHQFIKLNRKPFERLQVEPDIHYTGDAVSLRLASHAKIGAVPLWSPVTYKPELSLICKPRFGWDGIGPVLSYTGWRTLPQMLSMPQLRISERRIPPWVLSSVVLQRLEELIRQLDRRFEMTEAYHHAPKGRVHWDEYIRSQVPKGKFLNLRCSYPELQENAQLKAMVHFALKRQQQSLGTQRDAGLHVLQLIEQCNQLIGQVSDVSPERPSRMTVDRMKAKPLQAPAIQHGVEAIEWTAEEKGLAGLGDMHGLPWMMSMEELFESYVESILLQLTKRYGGQLRVGRKRETITPIQWDPPISGTQRYLLPDIVHESEDRVHIFDAKYKDHWEDLNIEGWHRMEEVLRERHREDLLQVLAYAAVPRGRERDKQVACTLMYPCRRATWESLVARRRHIHSAGIAHGDRYVQLNLSAIPFTMSAGDLEHLEGLMKS